MHGLPIVTTEMPGIDGFLLEFQNCIFCRARDPNDLAKCIARLVIEPDLAVKLGVAGHKKVEQLFAAFEHHSHADQVISLAESLFSDQRTHTF